MINTNFCIIVFKIRIFKEVSLVDWFQFESNDKSPNLTNGEV